MPPFLSRKMEIVVNSSGLGFLLCAIIQGSITHFQAISDWVFVAFTEMCLSTQCVRLNGVKIVLDVKRTWIPLTEK